MIATRPALLASLALLSACASAPPAADRPAATSDYCAEYRATMQGRSAEDKRRAAEEHIVRMHGEADAAHVERHLQMIERRCGS